MDNPEGFISSYLTASDQEWMDRHFVSEKSRIKLSDKKISERKNFDEHLDFINLVHKLSFQSQGKEHVIIKVLPYKKGRKKGYRAYHIYKDTDSRWVIILKINWFSDCRKFKATENQMIVTNGGL